MCSIAGEVSYKYDLKEKIEVYKKMNDLLASRGPDDEGIYLKHDVAFLHRRLAVIDVKKANSQ